MRFSIDKDVLEKLLNYVATRPFNEVAQLIQTVQTDIKQINEVQEKPINKVRAFPQMEPPTEAVK